MVSSLWQYNDVDYITNKKTIAKETYFRAKKLNGSEIYEKKNESSNGRFFVVYEINR